MGTRLDARAIWRWIGLEVVPAWAVIAVVAAIFWFTGHHIAIRYWVEVAIYLVIFGAGFSLIRRLRTRRRAARGSDQG